MALTIVRIQNQRLGQKNKSVMSDYTLNQENYEIPFQGTRLKDNFNRTKKHSAPIEHGY